MNKSREWYEGAVFALRQVTGVVGQQKVGSIGGWTDQVRLLRDYEAQLAAPPVERRMTDAQREAIREVLRRVQRSGVGFAYDSTKYEYSVDRALAEIERILENDTRA